MKILDVLTEARREPVTDYTKYNIKDKDYLIAKDSDNTATSAKVKRYKKHFQSAVTAGETPKSFKEFSLSAKDKSKLKDGTDVNDSGTNESTGTERALEANKVHATFVDKYKKLSPEQQSRQNGGKYGYVKSQINQWAKQNPEKRSHLIKLIHDLNPAPNATDGKDPELGGVDPKAGGAASNESGSRNKAHHRKVTAVKKARASGDYNKVKELDDGQKVVNKDVADEKRDVESGAKAKREARAAGRVVTADDSKEAASDKKKAFNARVRRATAKLNKQLGLAKESMESAKTDERKAPYKEKIAELEAKLKTVATDTK